MCWARSEPYPPRPAPVMKNTLLTAQLCLLSPAPRWTWFSRGSLLQGARQEEGKYENYGPDVPFPEATVSHRSRLGVARLDACSHRKRILSGAVPSPRSIPRPLLPRIPWRAAQPRCSTAPACLHKMVNTAGGPGGSGVRAKQLPAHLQQLVEGETHLPFLVWLQSAWGKGRKGTGEG